jgi:Tfp pilus assembly protein FimT
MIVMVIVAIGIALATPTYKSFIEKRHLTAAMEEIASLIAFAQGEAIKSDNPTTVSWYSPGGHSSGWCIGLTEGDTACDCTETDTTAADFCAIDGQPQRLVQTDFVKMNFEFMHMNPNSGHFTFDPVRGTIDPNTATAHTFDNYLFYVHSNEGSGSSREFELQLRVRPTGRVYLCTDAGRKRLVGGFVTCS